MNIGLDYDGTITEDKQFWLGFYHMAIASGHNVFVVTMRHESEPIGSDFGLVYYTGRKAKKPFCENFGLRIDVWIDDNPNWVFEDSF